MLGLTGVTIFGTLGYMMIEGWTLSDALYMTTITISTVGFGEVKPLSSAGQFFTVALIIVGVGAVLYMLAAMEKLLVEGRIRGLFRRERMALQIQNMQGHVIVAGYGRFGRAVAAELVEAGREVVVLDCDMALHDELERSSMGFVIGSAALDEDLERAGIRHAGAIVAGTPSEAENVFVTLAARELNPGIRIHVRSETEAGGRRLARAGADSVTAPFHMGGSRVAASIMQPGVVDFLELVGLEGDRSIGIEEVAIASESPFVGRTVKALEDASMGTRLVGIQSEGGEMVAVPNPDRTVAGGDLIVAIGKRKQLLELARRAEPGGS